MIGDIRGGSKPTIDPATRIAHRDRTELEPAMGTIGAAYASVDIKNASIRQRQSPRRFQIVAIVLMNGIEPTPSKMLLGRSPGVVLPLRVKIVAITVRSACPDEL